MNRIARLTGLVVSVVVLALIGTTARASTTTLSLYHLGDDDSNLTTTIDSFGSNNLTQSGTTSHSSDVGTPVQTISGSPNRTSMDFGGAGYYQGGVATAATSDIGFEMWVKPEAYGGFVFMNGNGFLSNGQYLEPTNSGWFFAKAGIGVVTFGTVTLDQWTELAVVLGDNVSGTVVASVYQNGVLKGSINFGSSNSAAGGFALGSGLGGSGLYDGFIDEFRVFSFTNFAAFNPATDLNLQTPEPASLSLLAVGGLLVLRRRR